MVDHSKTALTLSKEFYDLFMKLLSLITTEEIKIFRKMLLSLISKVEQAVPVNW